MKKIINICLALSLIFSMTACKSDEQASSSDKENNIIDSSYEDTMTKEQLSEQCPTLKGEKCAISGISSFENHTALVHSYRLEDGFSSSYPYIINDKGMPLFAIDTPNINDNQFIRKYGAYIHAYNNMRDRYLIIDDQGEILLSIDFKLNDEMEYITSGNGYVLFCVNNSNVDSSNYRLVILDINGTLIKEYLSSHEIDAYYCGDSIFSIHCEDSKYTEYDHFYYNAESDKEFVIRRGDVISSFYDGYAVSDNGYYKNDGTFISYYDSNGKIAFEDQTEINNSYSNGFNGFVSLSAGEHASNHYNANMINGLGVYTVNGKTYVYNAETEKSYQLEGLEGYTDTPRVMNGYIEFKKDGADGKKYSAVYNSDRNCVVSAGTIESGYECWGASDNKLYFMSENGNHLEYDITTKEVNLTDRVQLTDFYEGFANVSVGNVKTSSVENYIDINGNLMFDESLEYNQTWPVTNIDIDNIKIITMESPAQKEYMLDDSEETTQLITSETTEKTSESSTEIKSDDIQISADLLGITSNAPAFDAQIIHGTINDSLGNEYYLAEDTYDYWVCSKGEHEGEKYEWDILTHESLGYENIFDGFIIYDMPDIAGTYTFELYGSAKICESDQMYRWEFYDFTIS